MDNQRDFKLHELRCFDAVVREGSFQAAARAMHRSHPSVFAAVARLEARMGLILLDRSGYRASLTSVGQLFHARVRLLLQESGNLQTYARHLASDEETVLYIVLGDLCDRPRVLWHLSQFFAEHTRTRLHLDYEAIAGPAERLHDGTADLVFHRTEQGDSRVEHLELFAVDLIPVAAPNFCSFEVSDCIAPEDMRPFVQCVIRDTALRSTPEQHFLIDGAPSCTVSDHMMKKEIILHGMAWGHLPGFMIEDELQSGSLLSLRGRHLTGRTEMLSATRRRDRPQGPVAEALWVHLQTAFVSSNKGN